MADHEQPPEVKEAQISRTLKARSPARRLPACARLCAGALALAVLAHPAVSQTSLPPLPSLALDLFPPAAREAVSGVHAKATRMPTDPQAVGALGRVLQAWEQWEAAHLAYARAGALAPDVSDWHYLDGIVLQRLARHAEAGVRFRQAVAASPDYLPARVKLADALFEAGDLDESARLFEALSREPATEPMGRFGLGRIAAVKGQHEAAISHLQDALNRFPAWGAAHYALALSYRALGRRDLAQRALDQHARHGPGWPVLEDPVLASVNGLRDDAVASLQRGLKLADAGDLAGAIAAHEAAVARNPSLAQAHANLISLYGRTRDWMKAEQHYNTVVALGYNLDDAHYDYGVLLGLQEKWDQAAEAYRRAVDVNSLHSRAHNNLGQILERQGKTTAASEAYRRAVSSQPQFRLARFNLGRTLVLLGRTPEAILELHKLVEPRDAETPLYLFGLAGAYRKANRKAEALTWATEARRLALEHGQRDLAQAIERDLALLK
jgi:tetratricopeptide (TPR) repeat protein